MRKFAFLLLSLAAWALPAAGQDLGRQSLADFDIRSGQSGFWEKQAEADRKNAVDRLREELLRIGDVDLTVQFNALGLPALLQNRKGPLTGPDPDSNRIELARDFLRRHQDLFLLSDEEVQALRMERDYATDDGTQHLDLVQAIDGIPVFEGFVRFVFASDGSLMQAGLGQVLPGLDIDTNPALADEDAIRAAYYDVGRDAPLDLEILATCNPASRARFRNPHGDGMDDIQSSLVVFPAPGEDSRLAYEVYLKLNRLEWYRILVDAHSMELLFRENLLKGGLLALPSPGQNFPLAVGCNGTPGQWAGCRGNGCAVCTEKVVGYPLYFANHPLCTPNTTCNGLFFTCNQNCPAPTSADQCNGTSGQWAGCRGNGCAVCAEKVANYPLYFQNHPLCSLNTTCNGLFFTCNQNCPAPTSADQCNGTSGQWAGCRGNGCAVCAEKVDDDYPCYFDNHPLCSRNTTCNGLFFTCNQNCPAPTQADKCGRGEFPEELLSKKPKA